MSTPQRGKNADPNYVALVARLPRPLRASFQKYLIDTEEDTNTLVERLIRGLLSGVVALDELPPAAPPGEAAPLPATAPPKPRKEDFLKPSQENEYQQLRRSLGYSSASAFSQALGLNRTTWGRYERGEATPSDEVQEKLRIFLETRDV